MKGVNKQIHRTQFCILSRTLVFLLLLAIGYWLMANFSYAGIQEEIAERQKQIEELQKQIEGYQNQIDVSRGQSRTLENEIKQLNAKISQITLEIKGLELSVKKTDLEYLIGIQAVQKRSLGINRGEKDKLLKETKGQESKFQELIKQSQKDIEKIREQLTFLHQHGITAEDAVRYAQLAAIRAGIRPAFLLAILEIESRLGQNVGTGNWKDDMYECYIRLGTKYYPNRKAHYLQRAETEKNAFFAIIGKLGLNPDSVKVSREPNYGCGGAMGPAQFIPSTWLAYAEEVARLTGHNPPNPWSIEDAFMASAIKLAKGGADKQTRASESGAARAYIGGSTKCSSSICNYYSRTVLNKADELERNL